MLWKRGAPAHGLRERRVGEDALRLVAELTDQARRLRVGHGAKS
jgi:hypothetical protein